MSYVSSGSHGQHFHVYSRPHPKLLCRFVNLGIEAYTHLEDVHIIYRSLIAKWKEKTQFKGVNMLIIEGM